MSQHVPSWREQGLAVLTAAIGLAVTAAVGTWTAVPASPWLLTSMGATAVLVFAVPHGPLSQPWPVLGGHFLSALTALAIGHWLGNSVMTCALAVGLAIGVMHLTRCLHPPGGATALFMIQFAPGSIASAGSFLLGTLLPNVVCMLLTAFWLNYPFRWRRYPAALAVLPPPSPAVQAPARPLQREELAALLDGRDEFVDISDEQLQWLYETLQARLEAGPGTLSAQEKDGL